MQNKQPLRTRFFSSLVRGTGEAYLLYKQHPEIDFSDIIIKASVHNLAYDPQCEYDRASYIWRFIKSSRQRAKIVSAVLQRLKEEEKDDYAVHQMCDLAVHFYKVGYQDAKKALYNKFERNVLSDFEYSGKRQVMEVGEIEGVLKVAEVIGKKLLNDKDDYEDGFTLNEFARKRKELDVYGALERAAKRSRYVKAYMDSIRTNKANLSRSPKIDRFSYEIIKDKIDTGRLLYMSTSRANELSAAELTKFAEDFLKETDIKKKEQYLRFFDKRKFPLSYKPILKIASGRNPPKTRLVEFAVRSLKYFSGKDIRRLALEKLQSIRNPYLYLDLLVGNYKKNDHKLLLEIACRSGNPNYIHSLVSGFIDIYRANPTPGCKEPLEVFYNKMNCGIHRYDIVVLLKENNLLSEDIFKELQYDSSEEIRKFYRKHSKWQS